MGRSLFKMVIMWSSATVTQSALTALLPKSKNIVGAVVTGLASWAIGGVVGKVASDYAVEQYDTVNEVVGLLKAKATKEKEPQEA